MAKAKTVVEKLPQTYQTLLDRAVSTLQAMKDKAGIDFVVISEKYDIQVGTIDPTKLVKLSKRQRTHSKLPRGTLTSYLIPFMDNLQRDDLTVIPVKDFAIDSLQSSIASRATNLWGKGTYTALRTKDGKAVELWRLPEGMQKATLVDVHPLQVKRLPRSIAVNK